MTGLGIFVMVALWLPLIYLLLSNQYPRALCYGVFLLVSQSRYLVMETPGGLPNLTLHRLTLITLLLGWLSQPDLRRNSGAILFNRLFMFWLAVGAFSLMGSVDLELSIRRYLAFVVEIYVLYLVLSSSIRTPEAAVRIVRSIIFGLTLVAGIAIIERTLSIKPLVWLHPGSVYANASSDIISTMDHRILMGTGMAMGWPIAIGLLHQGSSTPQKRILLWCAVFMMIASCYFSFSRGPWVASMLVAVGLLVLMPKRSRRPLYGLAVIMVCLLIARPGVWGTLTNRTEQTFAEDSLKHSTFMYRIELWKIAYHGISASSWRRLLGNGPGAAGGTEFDWTLTYSGSDYKVWSWDNHYAALLYNTGFLGLLSMLLLQAAVLLHILRLHSQAEGERRVLLSCIAVSILAFLFMMTNVFIYAPQLNYVFWSLVAASLGLGAVSDEDPGEVGTEPAEAR
jgi:O-antigen ligase